MWNLLYIAAALLFPGLAPCATAATELLAPRHADPAQVASALAGNLPPGAAIKVYRQHLILSGSHADIEDMKRLIRLMDTPTRQLLISVRSAQSASQHRNHIAIDGSVRMPSKPRGSWQTTDTTLSLATQSRAAAISSDGTQSVRAAEGRDALLLISDPVVLPLGHGRSAIYDAGTGFWVNARVSGDQVVVSVHSRQQQAGTPHTITQIDTQISGAIGQWLPVGSISGSSERSARSLGSAGRSHQSSAGTLLLKVELLDGRP